jgi:hypothetical protein
MNWGIECAGINGSSCRNVQASGGKGYNSVRQDPHEINKPKSIFTEIEANWHCGLFLRLQAAMSKIPRFKKE